MNDELIEEEVPEVPADDLEEPPVEPTDEPEEIVEQGDPDPAETVVDQQPQEPVKPSQIRQVRNALRDKQRENAELRRQLQALAPTHSPQDEARPKLSDFEYDEDAFSKAHEAWAMKRAQRDAVMAAEMQIKQARYIEAKQKHGEAFDDAESIVASVLSDSQQSMAIAVMDDPSELVMALAKNQAALEKLATITDPIKFAFQLGQLKKEQPMPTKPKPAPESVPSRTAQPNTAKNVDQLLEQARKTGDYTKYFAATRQQKPKA